MKASLFAVVLLGCQADQTLIDDAPRAAATTQAQATHNWREQVIYLVIPDRFRNGDTSNDDAGAPDCFDPNDPQRYHGGDLAGIGQGLDYLKDLGVTALWVTPLYEQIERQPSGRCGYHGYWADFTDPDDAAIEPKYGNAETLSQLVDDVHAHGMRFMLDMVVNHSGDSATLPKQHPDWFHDPHGCTSVLTCPLDVHPDFAHEKPEVASYLSATAARWVARFGIDGIRMDTAKYVPTEYFHDSFFPAVLAKNPKLFSVAEIFDTGSTSVLKPYLDSGFDSAFHFSLRSALVNAVAHAGSVDEIARAVADGVSVLGIERALDLVLFVDNHDVPRFVNEPGVSVSEEEIVRRYLLALDLLFTLPGIPQLYSGDEIGLYGGRDPDNRRDLPTWASERASRRQAHPGQAVAGSDTIFTRIAKLASVRSRNPGAFAHGNYRELWRQNGQGNANVFAFMRGSGEDMRIVVINNDAYTSAVDIPIEGISPGITLIDELDDEAPRTLTLESGYFPIEMPPHSAGIYRIFN